jgi:molecular chaperone DnaJ
VFQRDHDDLHCEMPISFATAALGGEIEIPTLDGMARQDPRRDPERQGLPPARQGHQGRAQPRTGDLMCHVVVETPVNLTERQKELLREFEEISQRTTPPPQPARKGWMDKVKGLLRRSRR